jgi:catechol 2,3-dioxygenase-like lactoylglutathione lyase family enzyme
MTMARVLGIGGIFFKSPDPERLRAWYREHLGLPLEDWGGAVFRAADDPEGATVWSIHEEESDYFAPSTARFMVNFRVDDLDAILASLRTAGDPVDDKIEESAFGRFGWVMDPDGHRIELWQAPPAE